MSIGISRIDLSDLDFLIVDDNRFIRQLLTEILRGFGARFVREADGGGDAFRQIECKSPDLIFCDWMMSPVNGLSFLKIIRSSPRTQWIPVIMVSGYVTNDHVSAALDEGASSYIVKPFNVSTLMEHLLKVIAASENKCLVD